MAKGRTNQPLVIWVAPAFIPTGPVESLIQQGHRVIPMTQATLAQIDDTDKPDLILHPAAHQWNDMMWDYLPAALAAARKRKREAKSAVHPAS